MRKEIPHLGILASGSGSTFEKMILSSYSGELEIDIPFIIFSNPKAGGIKKAQELGKHYDVIDRRSFTAPTFEERQVLFGEAIVDRFKSYGVTAVSQNGWMVLTPPNAIEAFDEFDNQHAGPKFETEGTMGLQTHYVMIELTKETGINNGTHVIIHRVTPKYDQGETLAMEHVPILSGDTPQNLQERVKRVEPLLQIRRWNSYARGEELKPIIEPRYVPLGQEELVARLIAESKIKFPNG